MSAPGTKAPEATLLKSEENEMGGMVQLHLGRVSEDFRKRYVGNTSRRDNTRS